MRVDSTGFGNIKVIQNEGLGYGVDSVLLAAFAAGETGAKPIAQGARVADLGSGSGIVGFIVCHKIPATTVIGIEKRASAAARASEAAQLNGMTDRISFIEADVKDLADDTSEAAQLVADVNKANKYVADTINTNKIVADTNNVEQLRLAKFDAIVSNPPYFRQDAAIPNSQADKYVARHETTATIYDFAKAMSGMLDKGGDCYIVHRPDRLADIFEAMRDGGIEPKELQMVVPRTGEAANIVLIHGVKGAGKELKILPEIAVHTADGGYTELIESIYERNQ